MNPATVRELHQEIDLKARGLAETHASRLNCALGCAACCVDDLTVFEVEADRIREEAGHILETAPAPSGGCAFLDSCGACRIYESRPYVCRTQGLPLAWVVEEDGEWLEYRDICELNEAGTPLEELASTDCWNIGEAEQLLAALQSKHANGAGQRVALRDLFHGTV